ncbi:MAG: DNA replication and repair protein RecF, partial [Rickettsiales bacterium]
MNNHNILSVNQLELLNFRNYKYINLNFPKSPIIIGGDNGTGKTNILEAISLLSPGRGLKGAKLSEIDMMNQNSRWRINSTVYGNYGICDIVTFRIDSD